MTLSYEDEQNLSSDIITVCEAELERDTARTAMPLRILFDIAAEVDRRNDMKMAMHMPIGSLPPVMTAMQMVSFYKNAGPFPATGQNGIEALYEVLEARRQQHGATYTFKYQP